MCRNKQQKTSNEETNILNKLIIRLTMIKRVFLWDAGFLVVDLIDGTQQVKTSLHAERCDWFEFVAAIGFLWAKDKPA